MARSTSDGLMSITERASSFAQTKHIPNKHTHITGLVELAVDDELAVDELLHVEATDDIQQVSEAMLVQVL